MPIFEYVCTACGHRFEKLEKAGEAEHRCPSCGSSEVKKELSIFSAGSSSASGGCSPSEAGG